MVREQIKGTLSLCLLLVLCQSCAGGLADGKPQVSMLLSWNRLTILTNVGFLKFRLSISIPLMLLKPVDYSHYVHKARSASWLIICVWFCNTHLLGQVGAQCNSSEAWLMKIFSVVTITDTNGIGCLCVIHNKWMNTCRSKRYLIWCFFNGFTLNLWPD